MCIQRIIKADKKVDSSFQKVNYKRKKNSRFALSLLLSITGFLAVVTIQTPLIAIGYSIEAIIIIRLIMYLRISNEDIVKSLVKLRDDLSKNKKYKSSLNAVIDVIDDNIDDSNEYEMKVLSLTKDYFEKILNNILLVQSSDPNSFIISNLSDLATKFKKKNYEGIFNTIHKLDSDLFELNSVKEIFYFQLRVDKDFFSKPTYEKIDEINRIKRLKSLEYKIKSSILYLLDNGSKILPLIFIIILVLSVFGYNLPLDKLLDYIGKK